MNDSFGFKHALLKSVKEFIFLYLFFTLFVTEKVITHLRNMYSKKSRPQNPNPPVKLLRHVIVVASQVFFEINKKLLKIKKSPC